MKDGFVVIDADGHVLDWEPIYRARLPEKFRHRERIMGADDAFDRTQNGGIVRVMVNTCLYGRNVAHRDFWPFYEACAAKGVAVGFHSRGGDAIDPIAHFDNLLAMHTMSHAPEQLIACTAVIYSGLLEQFQ